MNALTEYTREQGVAFLSHEEGVEYYRGLVELLEGVPTSCHCENVDFGTYKNTVSMKEPYTEEIVCIDTCIATAIGYLWKQGVKTRNSCCGHQKILPTVVVAEESIEKMRELGFNNFEEMPDREDIFVL